MKVEKTGGTDLIINVFKAHKGANSKVSEFVLDVLKCLKENPESSAKLKKVLCEDPELKELHSKLFYSGVFNLWGTLW